MKGWVELNGLEVMIIEHCAPTLAGLKTANLFNYRYDSMEGLEAELLEINGKLNVKGVFVEVLKVSEVRALLYVYRRNSLERDMKDVEIRTLLQGFGYPGDDVAVCLERLRQRITENPCFPHEIGVFLSYPVSDVWEFIRHKGKNCKCCGVWSVYCDEHEALKTFQRFRKCTAVYRRVFADGKEITRLTVAA